MKTTESTKHDAVSRAGKWAVASGLIACLLACSVPVVAGLTGGALFASVLATGFFPQLEAVGLGMTALGLLALGGAFLAKRRHDGSVVCASAACSSSCEGSDDEEPAIACTLDAAGIKQRADRFRAVFARAFVRSERLDDGVRWRFADHDGLLEELRALAIEEHECCLFFDFDVQPRGREIWWETRTTERGQPVLEEFFKLPQTLLDESGEQLVSRMTTTFERSNGR